MKRLLQNSCVALPHLCAATGRTLKTMFVASLSARGLYRTYFHSKLAVPSVRPVVVHN